MTGKSTNLIRLSIGAILGSAAFVWSGNLPLDSQTSLLPSAEARIGRPLTPLSYAGVARRTTRRAVAVGAVAAGAAYAAPMVVTPAPVVPGRCVQAVDPYGRIYTRCY